MSVALRAAFTEQAGYCKELGSPFMDRILRLLAAHWPEDTKLAAKLAAWQGDIGPMADSLPLRVTGGLHALRLMGKDAGLEAAYPATSPTDDQLCAALVAALRTHDDFLCRWVDNAPQTNEVRRAAALIAGAHLLASRFDMPLRLSELGASGGLNLMFDQFHLTAGGTQYGPQNAPVSLAPKWAGTCPDSTTISVAERRGVDLNPLDAHAPKDALRLLAYLWPDQTARLTRTRAATALQDAPVDRADAIDWLERRLVAPASGQLHLVYHTVAWQYFPTKAQTRGTALMKAAGARATENSPLAWLKMEADTNTPGARLSLRYWPGDVQLELGRIDFHGRWVDWSGPAKLS